MTDALLLAGPLAWLAGLLDWLAGLATYKKVLIGLATTMFVVELVLRRWPKSNAYKRWQHGIEAIGSVWTAVILSVVYVLSVGPVSLVMRTLGHDPLDRVHDGASTWRKHEPNPLGPVAAARHQF